MVDFEIRGLSFYYPNEEKPALKNIDLKINNGEFTVICGRSGSGKSTLLRMLKPELSPRGKKEGEIVFFGQSEKDFSRRASAEKIGYLLQNTQYQTVTHSVRTELAFGLENLGLDSKTIRLRIAEIAAYFSLESILDKKISELSGGKKQMVCLASILAMHPKTVIFDEPASQLDPVSAESLLSAAHKMCRENGITVIMTEHRLQNVIPMADRLIVLEDGGIIADTSPRMLDTRLFSENEFINLSMPAPMRIFSALHADGELPLTVGEARKRLNDILKNKVIYRGEKKSPSVNSEKYAIEAKNLYFSYDRQQFVLNNFSLKVPVGSFFTLLGANAAGKSTAIGVISGLLPCKSGKVIINGKDIRKYKASELYNGTVAVLPQNPESLFSGNTLLEDLEAAASCLKLSKEDKRKRLEEITQLTEISHLCGRHPYDLSGGELQRAALCIVLLKEPEIIFMDEPTKGMDSVFKRQFAKIIKELCSSGVTVIQVSHDTEFTAEYADMCAMVFDGTCAYIAPKDEFFASNFFYTTNANKIARDHFPEAVTESEVISLCIKSLQG